MVKEKEIVNEEIIENVEMLKVKLSNDVMFKALFLKEGEVFLQILKDILDIRSDEIITIVGYETVPNNIDGKIYRGDLLIKLSDETYVSIEMNNSNPRNALSRNMIHLFRIHSDIIGRSLTEEELERYRMYQLNFNNFRNKNKGPVEKFGFCSLDTKEISSLIYTFCSVDIAKCQKMIYNLGVDKVSKSVRWGAIMLAKSIEEISYILGDDMLGMESKEKFLGTIRELNDDEKVVKASTWELNARLRYESDLACAKEQGIEQGIEDNKKEVIINMLKKKIDYNMISDVTGKTLEEIKEIEKTI